MSDVVGVGGGMFHDVPRTSELGPDDPRPLHGPRNSRTVFSRAPFDGLFSFKEDDFEFDAALACEEPECWSCDDYEATTAVGLCDTCHRTII